MLDYFFEEFDIGFRPSSNSPLLSNCNWERAKPLRHCGIKSMQQIFNGIYIFLRFCKIFVS